MKTVLKSVHENKKMSVFGYLSAGLVLIALGCSSKPKEEDPAPPNMDVPATTMGAQTAKAESTDEKSAKSSSGEVSVKNQTNRITKSDAKKACKDKGLKGKDLKNCMREMTN